MSFDIKIKSNNNFSNIGTVPFNSEVVHITTDETIAGVKSFSNYPKLADSTDDIASTSNDKTLATTAFVNTKIDGVIDSAPSTLNTLDKLAAAINDDATYYSTVNTALATKQAVLKNGAKGGNVVVSGSGNALTSFTATDGFVTITKDTTFQEASTAVTHTASTAVGSATQPVYVDSTGVATATTYSLSKSVPSTAEFTDSKVNVTLGTTTKAYLVGVTTAPTATASAQETISDTGVYLDTTAGTITATSFNGTATRATADAGGNTISTTYMHLTGSETITGAKDFTGATLTAATQANTDNGTNVATTAFVTNKIGALTASDIPSLDASKITSGKIDIARLPSGALERLVLVNNQKDRYDLTQAQVQTGDTVKQIDTGVMYFVVDDSKLDQSSGYVEYTAGTATSVAWSGVTDKPSTFTPSSHTHGNISNDGKVGTDANLVLATGTGGIVTTTPITTTELGYLSGVSSSIQTQFGTKQDSSTAVTHTASTAVGSATQPVFVASNGVATATTYSLAKSVPSDAVFTDTVTTISDTVTGSGNAITGLTASNGVLSITKGTTFQEASTAVTHTASTAVGSVTQPVYIDSTGVATVTSYSLAKSVPSDALFTDVNLTQTVSTTNSEYPLLAKDSTGVSTTTATSVFADGVTINPSTKTITATSFNGTATKATADANGNNIATTYAQKSTSVSYSGSGAVGSSMQPVYINLNGSATAVTHTLNADVPSTAEFTDSKVNVTLGTTTKAYLVGVTTAPTSTASAQETISDTGVYLDTTAGKITATTFNGDLTGNASTATKATQDASGNTITTTYAPLASPSFTGTPTIGTNSIATESYVDTEIATVNATISSVASSIPTSAEINSAISSATSGSITAAEVQSMISSSIVDNTISSQYSDSRDDVIEAETNYTVPSYTVGNNALLVFLDGALATKTITYIEVGNTGDTSTTIQFNCDIPATTSINAIVLDNLHLNLTASGTRINVVKTFDREHEALDVDDTYTVSSYIVGSNTLSVFLNGVLCEPGFTYEEVGNSGTASTTIRFKTTVNASTHIAIHVIQSI